MRRSLALLLVLCAAGALAVSLPPAPSRAESWCADPLWVHEWGVQVFADGGTGRRAGPNGAQLPRYFHNAPRGRVAAGPPVRGMDVDSGMRALPILHFYADGTWMPVPVGIEVGFTQGDAAVWYPQVDARRTAADANGAAARAGRAQLLQKRAARANGAALTGGAAALLPADPTRQLQWDHLVLTPTPRHRRASSGGVAWVDRLRGFNDALWVNGNRESERFVFYEARTRETQAIRIERGPTYASGRRHFILRNVGARAVHDVFVVHREGADTFVFNAPRIPAGQTAGLVLEQHRTTAQNLRARTRDALRRSLVDGQQPSAPRGNQWDMGNCVMQRDPAIPFDTAQGHRLYTQEVDAILDVWGRRFFDAPGTTIVYREDPRYLDDVMPLSIYTDMYHYAVLNRAGLALIANVRLP